MALPRFEAAPAARGVPAESSDLERVPLETSTEAVFDRQRRLCLRVCHPLCLLARGGAATSIGHSKTTNRRSSPVTTMNQQPNIVQVRNGSPRSRSRSVSRSRSRSASPSAEREPRGNPYDLPDKSPTNGEEVAAKMGLRHLEKCGVAPTVREMTGRPVERLGTVTGELLMKLVKQLEETRGDSVALDEPLAIDA